MDKTKRGWWKSAVFYQIYPKSFRDSGGDGIGDLPGIVEKLDYLKFLGIDGIWLSPVCASPQVDNGYDISDYRAIWPTVGTMADMETLIREAGKRDITIIMDLVLNHTSNQHPWFLEALKGRDNAHHDYYVWRDGAPDQPPNEMRACFGGSAWTYVPELGQYYFHQFAPEQPDLNWDDPTVRRELYDMIRFWVDKGVGGFRLDVIDQIAKDPDRKITGNGPRLHEFLRELSREAFREEGLVTVGEAWGADVERAKLYSAPDGSELGMVFQFQHIGLDQKPGGEKWDLAPLPLPALKACMERWQQGLHGRGWNSLFLNNHDLPRIVSRWGDDGRYRVESAKMLATMLHGMEGTPYIYQGEELGMTNIRLPIDQYRDLETRNLYTHRLAQGYPEEDVMASIYARSRDNARTPMQWTAGPNAGFTDGTPWMPVNPNYTQINAEAALADPDSIFYHYQALIRLRKTYPVFRDGDFELLEPGSEELFVYTRRTEREALLVVCNFTGGNVAYTRPAEFEDAVLLLSNYKTVTARLRPYEAQIFYRKEGLRYRNCIFDLYGTLVDIHTDEDRPVLWEHMARWYTDHGAAYTPEELKEAYLAEVRRREQGSDVLRRDAHEAHPEIQLEEVFARLFLDKGVAPEAALVEETGAEFRRASTDYIRLYPGVTELLHALRANGQGVYLLSNAQRVFTVMELEQLGLRELFDGVYLSSDYGCKKPDPRFFRLPLDEHGIDPKSAIMVGNDGLCDIQGARALGLATLYIRSNISPKEPTPAADYVLKNMDMERVKEILTQ